MKDSGWQCLWQQFSINIVSYGYLLDPVAKTITRVNKNHMEHVSFSRQITLRVDFDNGYRVNCMLTNVCSDPGFMLCDKPLYVWQGTWSWT